MELTGNLQIVCPIRGQLKVNKRSKDGLTATEEFYRVEAIKFLLSKGYPKENFWIEPIIKKFAFEVRGDEPLEIQDYRSLGTSADTTKKKGWRCRKESNLFLWGTSSEQAVKHIATIW